MGKKYLHLELCLLVHLEYFSSFHTFSAMEINTSSHYPLLGLD